MNPLSKEQKAKVVQLYFKTGSAILAQRAFRSTFKVRYAPDIKTIKLLSERFLAVGSIEKLNQGRSGRKRSKRSSENIEKVKTAIQETPTKSIRKLAAQVHSSKSTVQRILKKDLRLTPYKISVHQTLSDNDKTQRIAFASWFCDMCTGDGGFLDNLWCSDEAHFLLNGGVNTQNCRIWANTLPDTVMEKPLHSEKVTVWCAMSSKGIIGPFWFQDGNGSTTTINKERYVKTLERFWGHLCRQYAASLDNMWFQQDGAAPHTSNMALEWLQQHFGDRCISRKVQHPWPAHSPDLTPLDFFLWGYLKSKVYERSPETLEELKNAIEREIKRIPAVTCARVMEEMKKRATLCVQRNGSHLEHVL